MRKVLRGAPDFFKEVKWYEEFWEQVVDFGRLI
jgi:hypothetical protein